MSDTRGRQLNRSSDASQHSSLGEARSHFSPSPSKQEEKARRRTKSRQRKEKNQPVDIRESEKEYIGMFKKFLNIKITKETAAAAAAALAVETARQGQQERESKEATEATEAMQRQINQIGLAIQEPIEPEPTLHEFLKGPGFPGGTRMPPIEQCPFIRPLENKMIARQETSFRAHRLQKRKASTTSSSCSSVESLNRPGSGETSRFSDDRIQNPQFHSRSSSIAKESNEGRELQVHVAPEDYSVNGWNAYISCYQEV